MIYKFSKIEGLSKIDELKRICPQFDYRLEVFREFKGLNNEIDRFMNEIDDEPITDNTLYFIDITVKGTNTKTSFDTIFENEYISRKS